MPEISVVIPTYNRLDTLKFVVPALLDQDLPLEQYEIVVGDSNSTDGTREYLARVAEEFPNVRHVPGAYGGRAAARNAGIRAAQGDVILFNDSDIVPADDLLYRHLVRHRTRRKIAVVGWEVQVKSYEDYLSKRAHPELRGALHPSSRKKLGWLYFLTGNASVRREDLLRVGCFDESFTGYGHEDLELGFRLQRAGVPIVYEPRAVNYHWQHIPWDEQQRKYEQAGRSTVRFYRKHPVWDVKLRLGMTPLSLGLHGVVERVVPLRAWIENGAAQPGFARTLSYQYHYLTGVKAALRGR